VLYNYQEGNQNSLQRLTERLRSDEGNQQYSMEETMKLMSPKVITFWIAVVLAVLGLIGQLGLIAAISATVGFWLLFIGFVLLALGVLFKGL
jgi:1,4-dihydroxy-2-naphthoate octaprenyltransferase